ncbi:MAG: acetate/propionate family kinase, partial [Planctomycetes bacterium]|nr:acetate/propionate family kinase [Planctomycetota bacterium]
LGARIPMVAVFDTSFHSTIPEPAATYAIPWQLAEKHGIRRFGFHGTSYRWVLERYCALANTTANQATLVAFHLGNGASAVAIERGRSVDTSMGFTPLEGLVMGTRAGDMDPALVAFIAEREKLSPKKIEDLLNSKSGLLGVSGRSKDMRDLLEHQADDPRARLALEVFCHRARKYLGSYLAVLRGADAVAFTGGIGEHAATVRARICDGMEWCGIRVDAERNERVVGVEGEIGARDSKLRVFVIPTDEEWLISRDAAECVRKHLDA